MHTSRYAHAKQSMQGQGSPQSGRTRASLVVVVVRVVIHDGGLPNVVLADHVGLLGLERPNRRARRELGLVFRSGRDAAVGLLPGVQFETAMGPRKAVSTCREPPAEEEKRTPAGASVQVSGIWRGRSGGKGSRHEESSPSCPVRFRSRACRLAFLHTCAAETNVRSSQKAPRERSEGSAYFATRVVGRWLDHFTAAAA